MKHDLQALEDRLRQARAPRAPRPEDWTGSRMNQTRRRLAYQSALEAYWKKYRAHRRAPRARVSQETWDQLQLGAFLPWIVAARAEAAAAARVAKAQAILQHLKRHG